MAVCGLVESGCREVVCLAINKRDALYLVMNSVTSDLVLYFFIFTNLHEEYIFQNDCSSRTYIAPLKLIIVL